MRSDFLLELRDPLGHYASRNGVCPTP